MVERSSAAAEVAPGLAAVLGSEAVVGLAAGVGVPVAPRETMDSRVEVAIVASAAVVRAATGEYEAVKVRK